MKATAPKQTPSPWPRVFGIVTVFLVLFLIFLFKLVYRDSDSAQQPWLMEVESFVASDKSPNALAPLSEAFSRTDWESLQRKKQELRELALSGWKNDNTEARALIGRDGFLISAVTASSEMTDVVFPSTAGMDIAGPRPPFELLETLGYFLAANARMVEAQGRSEEALTRLGELAILGHRLCRPRAEASLSGHLAGLALVEMSLNGMLKILSKPGVSETTSEKILRQVTMIDTEMVPLNEAFQEDASNFADEIRAAGNSPSKLAGVIQFYQQALSSAEALQLARSLQGDVESFSVEHEKVWRAIDTIAREPVFRRPVIDDHWLDGKTRNRLVRLYFPEIETLFYKEAATHARLRLARAILMKSLGREKDAKTLMDPFSGKAVGWNETLVYSVGPDLQDDGAQMLHEPSVGPKSPGDIVAYFPPSVDP